MLLNAIKSVEAKVGNNVVACGAARFLAGVTRFVLLSVHCLGFVFVLSLSRNWITGIIEFSSFVPSLLFNSSFPFFVPNPNPWLYCAALYYYTSIQIDL